MEEKFKKHDVRIVVVTFEGGYFAGQYRAENKLKWPLLVDTNRDLYRKYGMLQASFLDIWGPKTWLAYFREILRGNVPKKSSGDISQRGGDVLIDPLGIIRLHHVGAGPADRPSGEDILQVVEKDAGNPVSGR